MPRPGLDGRYRCSHNIAVGYKVGEMQARVAGLLRKESSAPCPEGGWGIFRKEVTAILGRVFFFLIFRSFYQLYRGLFYIS